MKRKWIILLLFLLITFIGYKYVYQEHRDIKTEKAEFVVNSTALANEFSTNSNDSEKKYLNKTIEITGFISEISGKTITLNHMIFCQFNTEIKTTLKIDQTIKIKGRFIGFDDLLELVKIDQSTIIE